MRETRPKAVIVDLDGTLVDVATAVYLAKQGDLRAFHEACRSCPPHPIVVDWVTKKHRMGLQVLLVTGRDAWARALTEEWAAEHLPTPFISLWMRAENDYRSNVDVKRDLFEDISRSFRVEAAIDNEPDIVDLWIELGVPHVVAVSDLHLMAEFTDGGLG